MPNIVFDTKDNIFGSPLSARLAIAVAASVALKLPSSSIALLKSGIASMVSSGCFAESAAKV